MVNVAVKAARRAGRVIVQGSQNLDALTIRHKSLNDLVSEVDRASEQAIIDVLQTAYPDHAILAEESGASGDSEFVWVIDPLDGTTNFLHGFQQYCVSIALVHRGVITHGVIFDPTRPTGELENLLIGEGEFIPLALRHGDILHHLSAADIEDERGPIAGLEQFVAAEHREPRLFRRLDNVQNDAGLVTDAIGEFLAVARPPAGFGRGRARQ